MALSLLLDECIDNTHVLVTKRNGKEKKTTKRTFNKRSKAKKGKEQDHLKKTRLGPIR
jgi:hypothetical protein